MADRATYPALGVERPNFFTYGLGWFLHDYRGEAVAMHTGSINGMSAIVGMIPERKLGVVVLANTDHAELRHALMYRVFDAYAGEPRRDWSAELRTLYGERQGRAAAAAGEREGRRAIDSRPSLPVERYAGTYTNPTYGDVAVTVRDGRLQLTFGRGFDGDLTHWEYETFRARWSDPRRSPSNVVLLPDGTGGVTALRAFGTTFARTPSP